MLQFLRISGSLGTTSSLSYPISTVGSSLPQYPILVCMPILETFLECCAGPVTPSPMLSNQTAPLLIHSLAPLPLAPVVDVPRT